MTNRIGGDFNADAVEAFRAAYAAQLMTPEDLDTHEESGLPGNTISNTSPWIAHTGLWKYPSGKGPDDDLQKPFNVQEYLPEDEEQEDDEDTESEGYDDEEDDTSASYDDENEELNYDDLTAEELDALVEELLGSFDEEFETDDEDE